MCFFFPSLRLAALSIWLSYIQSVLVLQSHRNLRFPPSQFQNRAKTSEALRIARCFLTVQVCFLGVFYDLVKCVFFSSLRLAALSIWLSHIQSVLVLQSHRNLRFPPSQFQNRAKTSEALRIARCFLTVQVCFLGVFRKWRHNQRTIALSLEHKFVMADAKNLHFQAQYFHLEGANVHFNDRNRYSHFW